MSGERCSHNTTAHTTTSESSHPSHHIHLSCLLEIHGVLTKQKNCIHCYTVCNHEKILLYDRCNNCHKGRVPQLLQRHYYGPDSTLPQIRQRRLYQLQDKGLSIENTSWVFTSLYDQVFLKGFLENWNIN